MNYSCDAEQEFYIDSEYKDYNTNNLNAKDLKKTDIQNKIKNFISDLINEIKNNLSFSDVACWTLKILVLLSISLACLLSYLLKYFLEKLLAYLMNLLSKIIEMIMNKLMEIISAIIDKLLNLLIQIFTLIENLISMLLAFIDTLLNTILTVLDRILEFLSNLIAWLLNCLPLDHILSCLNTNLDEIGVGEPINDPMYSDIIDNNYRPLPIIREILDEVNKTKDEIKNNIADTTSNLTRLTDNRGFTGDQGMGIGQGGIDNQIATTAAYNAISDLINNTKNQLVNLVNNINDNLRNNLPNYDTDLYNSIYNLTDEDRNNMNNILNYFGNVLDDVVNNNLQNILNEIDNQLTRGEIC